MASNSTAQDTPSGPPPAYAVQDDQVDALAAGTQHLSLTNLDDGGDLPSTDQALAHLKLLHAIHVLRDSVRNSDGLFDLHDDDVRSSMDAHKKASINDRAQLKDALLARLKEKRWAVYVSRAAYRFETWWAALRLLHGDEKLTNAQMESRDFELSVRPKTQGRVISRLDDLPPLDVLMVWHAFMLNPRCYLEDCLRQGMMRLWHNRMPWAAINAAIDGASEEYNLAGANGSFKSLTGLNWSNLDDGAERPLTCSHLKCQKQLHVPFTDLPRKQIVKWVSTSVKKGLWEFPAGTGYADGEFDVTCPSCHGGTSHSALQACKFRNDFLAAYNDGADRESTASPMPGTILDKDGAASAFGHSDPRRFPSRLLIEMFDSGRSAVRPARMEEARDIIESALKTTKLLSSINSRLRAPPSREARINVRRMMSRYWDNSSPFAIDLVGAVIRQGAFIEKMEDIDWLHSPAAASTMSRLIQKYERFFNILSTNPGKLIVPTLDVDLAWHTHQLNSVSYYRYSYAKTSGKFIDHDDKIAETALSTAFAETSRLYQNLYKAPYSECTCWYCEAIRASHDSGVSRLFHRSSANAAEESLYDPKNPNRPTSDPDRGPHISAHSAIRPTTQTLNGKFRTDFDRQVHRVQSDLAAAYEKACKRAKKAGRPEPAKPPFLADPRNRSASSTLLYYPAFFLPIGVPYYGTGCDSGIYASNPGCANFSPGASGNCASGSCGGGVAAGACGSGGGSACAAGGGSCVGGGGGGCGGNAGGGCGGGGGGGCGGGGGGCGGGGGGGCGGGGGG